MYGVCLRFRLMTRDEDIWIILKQALFFEAAGAVAKTGLSLKQNHHTQVLPSYDFPTPKVV